MVVNTFLDVVPLLMHRFSALPYASGGGFDLVAVLFLPPHSPAFMLVFCTVILCRASSLSIIREYRTIAKNW